MSHASKSQRARKRLAQVLLVAALTAASATASAVERTESPKPVAQQQHHLQTRPTKWTGDFDVLLKRRVIRMLVPYSPTLFYHDRGQARGIVAEASAELEAYLNKKFPDKAFYPVNPDATCAFMKTITLDRVIRSLETMTPQVRVFEPIATRAKRAIDRMLELA